MICFFVIVEKKTLMCYKNAQRISNTILVQDIIWCCTVSDDLMMFSDVIERAFFRIEM